MLLRPADRRAPGSCRARTLAGFGALVLATVSIGAPAGAASLQATTAPLADTSAAIHPYGPTAADQVVVVNAASLGTSSVQLTAYRWSNGAWQAEIGPISGGIGVNGFTATPHEADGFTPVGQYSFTAVFGSRPDPGALFPYHVATNDDHWVDDPSSLYYNTWQVGPSAGRWQSAETLSNYAYAASFDFNQQPVVANANSAIFLHGGGGSTPGCIETGTPNLLAVLRWLDPAAHPIIVLGVGVGPPAHLDAGDVVPARAGAPAVRQARVTNPG